MEHRKTKERILDIAVDVGASFLLGIGLISFIEPVNIAPGGISGISLMIKYVWDIPLGTMNFLLNLPLLGLAWRYLGKKFTLKTTKTILINTIILDGIFTTLNGNPASANSDYGTISLATEWNNFTVDGADSVDITFSFPFVYI